MYNPAQSVLPDESARRSRRSVNRIPDETEFRWNGISIKRRSDPKTNQPAGVRHGCRLENRRGYL